MAQGSRKNDTRQIVIFDHPGSVTLVNVVSLIVACPLLWREETWTAAGTRAAVKFVWCLRGKTQEEVVETAAVATVLLSEEENEKHWFRMWCGDCCCLGFR